MKRLLENWRKQLEEELEDYKSSFEVKDDFTPEIWENEQLKHEVRQVLREIAMNFFEGLDLGQIEVLDIVLTGSIANYNWSEYSDIDIHIIVDFEQVDENIKLVKDFFNAKKSVWNNQHEILVMGYEVELYVQDVNEPHAATGMYSVLNNEWLVKPNKFKPEINWDDISLKVESLDDQIDRVEVSFEAGDYEQANMAAIRLQQRLKKFRKSGLETAGEFSVENLAFKVLRRSGSIGDLIDIKHRSYDAMMSLESPLPQ